jgi:hypothetical protein
MWVAPNTTSEITAAGQMKQVPPEESGKGNSRNAALGRWATCFPSGSRHNWQSRIRRPLRGSLLNEFFKAWEIYLPDVG